MSTDLKQDREDATSRARMAARIRRLREARGLTIQTVAERGGIAISTVSKIERNLMAPTYDRFTRLARGLGVDVTELFLDEASRFEEGGVAVARRGDSDHHETGDYSYEMLFPEVRGKSMVPMIGTLKPREKMAFGQMVSHAGEEFLLVMAGRVLVQLAGREDVVLEQGESLYIDSRRGHLYASALEDPARILVVCTRFEPRDLQP